MSAGLLITLPVALPMVAAVVAFVVRHNPALSRVLPVVLGAVLTLLGILLVMTVWRDGPMAVTMGSWPPPFGISFVADLFSASMVLITGIIGLAVAVYALADVDDEQMSHGFGALFMMLLTGVNGAFLTADIFNLYVWFEVMLISSFGLLVIGGSPARSAAAVTYVTLNLVSTLLFLIAVALLYGLAGTLNMGDLHRVLSERPDDGTLTVVAMLFLGAFGIKAGVFPLFFWLPASYHTPTPTVSALFAALLTKVGVYALVRVFTTVFPESVMADLQGVLLWIAMLTMVVGVMGAAAQDDIRRILSFHIISQIGYMVLGLALYTPLAILGAVFYVLHHIIVKANLFLIAGVIRRDSGGEERLVNLGGLYKRSPLLAMLFLVPALSLAGLPPLSGFWAKFLVIKASLDAQAWLAAGVALVVGLLTLYSMSKIWLGAFWKPAPEGSPAGTGQGMGKGSGESRLVAPRAMLWPIIALAAITLFIGLWAQPLLALAEAAAAELFDPAAYARIALGAAS